jgi:hypothetical protein
MDINWTEYDRLNKSGLLTGEIAKQLGMSYGTLYYKLSQRRKKGASKPTSQPKAAVPQKPHAVEGSITLALPESAIDGFLLKLPIERKAEIFTAELAASR